VQLGLAIIVQFLLLFKSFVLIKCLLGLPILVVVLLAVEGGLSFEVSPGPLPHLLDILLHHHENMRSPIRFFPHRFILVFFCFLDMGPVLEGFDHRDVKCTLVVDLITYKTI
jgi:hypothetical protein